MIEAATLTGIGMATAFGLLLLLIVAVVAVRLICGVLFDRGGAETSDLTTGEDDSRDKALAAAIAVATLASRPRPIVRREDRA